MSVPPYSRESLFRGLLRPEAASAPEMRRSPAVLEPGEAVLAKFHPTMFRAHPVAFLACAVFVPAFGVGVAALFAWWLKTVNTALVVTERRIVLCEGVFARHYNEVMHTDVQNIDVFQTFMNRLFGVGRIGISTAGQSGIEILICGVRRPCEVKQTIDRERFRGRNEGDGEGTVDGSCGEGGTENARKRGTA